MENSIEKYGVCTKTDLINIINSVIEKYGIDANEFVNKKIEDLKFKKTSRLASVSSITTVTNTDMSLPSTNEYEPKKEKIQKIRKDTFDMSQYRQRHIALQLQYEGEPYFGFASQTGESEETIEKHLFAALIKVKLIKDRASCNYSRCGRTDSGVSAYGQIIALNLRSAFPKDLENLPEHPSDFIIRKRMVEVNISPKLNPNMKPGKNIEFREMEDKITEIDYVGTLNRNLPKAIRVIAWKEVTPQFSARFSCSGRTYRYFFTRKRVNVNTVVDSNTNTNTNSEVKVLDIERMNKAAAYLVGEHDFRNLCKMDVSQVSNFKRTIYSAEVKLFSSLKTNGNGNNTNNSNNSSNSSSTSVSDDTEDVYMLEISGLAFLWHMVRCVMSVLFLVGYNREEPEIVQQLLNLDEVSPHGFPNGKPHYSFAPELPLVLHKCHFDHMVLNHHMPKVLWATSVHYNMLVEYHMLAAMRAKNSYEQLLECTVRTRDVVHSFLPHIKKLYSCGKTTSCGGAKSNKTGKTGKNNKKSVQEQTTLGYDSNENSSKNKNKNSSNELSSTSTDIDRINTVTASTSTSTTVIDGDGDGHIDKKIKIEDSNNTTNNTNDTNNTKTKTETATEMPFRDVIRILLDDYHISPASPHSNSYIPKADSYIKFHNVSIV